MEKSTKIKKCYECKQTEHFVEFYTSVKDQCKPCHAKHAQTRYQKNKSKLSEYYKIYNKKEENKKRRNENERKRKKENLNYKLMCSLRTRMSVAIKRGVGNIIKGGSTIKDLGCSIYDFKNYIESLFQLGMNWENYGRGPDKWNLDHIIPLSLFDLSNREQFLKACHYTNLQPLWHLKNISKGNRIPKNGG